MLKNRLPRKRSLALLVLPLALPWIDLAVLGASAELREALGSWYGLEMGLLVGLNLLGALLLLEFLDEIDRRPPGFGWYYRLPLGCQVERAMDFSLDLLTRRGPWKLGILLVPAFFIFENFLLPFTGPTLAGLPLEVGLVLLITLAVRAGQGIEVPD